MPTLHAEQLIAKDTMISDLRKSGFTLLKAGIRAGKTTIVGKLIEESDYTTVSVLAKNYQEAMHACQPWFRRDIMLNKWPEPNKAAASQALIVLENVMWCPNSFANFLLARHRGHHVIAIGSKGPEFDKINEWCVKGGLSYNSWDLNPELEESEMRAKFKDDVNFERDFCAY